MSGQMLTAPKNAALKRKDSQSETRYCMQLCRNLGAWDMFEGYVTNGLIRHGNSRCSWSDGDVMHCCWKNGRCDAHESRVELKMTRSKTNIANKKVMESHCTENPPNFLGNCIHCKELCNSDKAFACLNCQAAYCKTCNEHWKGIGYETLRSPCFCIINSEGIATPTWNADLKTWIPKEVIGHVFSRETAATLKGTTFIIIYQHVTLKHKSTSLCQLGKLGEENRACFLQHDVVKVYVKSVIPQPASFAQLQKQWNAQKTTYPVVINSQIFQNPWRSDLVKKWTPDVDSLTIKNFKLTEDSIDTLLIPLVGRPQVDVGTTFTKVRPEKGYHILCGPRPVMMVYCNPLHAVAMKKRLVSTLGNLTNASYTSADSGYNVFRQSPASVDVKVLFKAWLKVASEFGCENERVHEKMKLLNIVFHGWKSNPENIIDPFQDGRLYNTCKSECSEFEVTYDIARRYEADQGGENTEETKMVKAAVFGIAKNIPGFSGRTWSMFGPIAGEQPMGSIMFDRTNSVDTCLPQNVKRVKVYSSIVNLIKSRMTLSGVTLNKMTHKKLKYQGDKVHTFLDEIEANCIEHSKMLKSFRIEYSIMMNKTHCSIQELQSQIRTFEENFLEELRNTTRLGLIAVSDIQSLCRWSLGRYRKKCRGANEKLYHDQIQAKDMLLSLWHTAGFHHFPLTQQKHARYLIDMSDDDDDETSYVEKEHPCQRNKLRSSTDFDWTNANQTSLMLEALKYMSIAEFTFTKGCNIGNSGFRYFYKKICTIPDNGQPCPWCYSKKLVNKIERVNAEPLLALNRKLNETKAGDSASKKALVKPPCTLETSISKIKKAAAKRAITTAVERRGDSFVKEYACKSNDFSDPIDLAVDVLSRLQYHIEMLSGSEIRWTTDELPHLIARLFIKSKEEKSSGQKIISEVEAKMKPVRLRNDTFQQPPQEKTGCQSDDAGQNSSQISDAFHMSTIDYQPNIGARNAQYPSKERRKQLLMMTSDSFDSNCGTSKSEVAKIHTTSTNMPNYGEPEIMHVILFSMQSASFRDSFKLDCYMNLWTLERPEPIRRNITIGGNTFEVSSFGKSIKPFLHQATFNLLSLDTTNDWIGIHKNQSFIIHLAVAMNRCPFALHTMFERNCKRTAREKGVWIHHALEQVYPSDMHMNVVIVSKESDDSPCAIQQYRSPCYGQEETAIVLLREGMNYSWLKNANMHDMNLNESQQLCRSAACVTWGSLTTTSVCIKGNPNSNEATSTLKQDMWDNASAAVGLRKSSTGKWKTIPPGFERDLSLQDGSLTPASFEKLLQTMQSNQINCQMVADLGSEAGHAVACFAFKPFVKQVTGIEIQFPWAAYSAIVMLQLQSLSQNNNSYFADTCIIHDSFLNTENHLWGNALQKADLCFCNNFNWDKAGKANPVPKEHQQLEGEFKHSINANVAELLNEYMKRNSHVVVFESKNFSNQRYQKVRELEVHATWSTQAKVELLKTNSCHFKYLTTALQAICQNNNVDFDKIPRDWFADEGHSPSSPGYIILKNHVMKSAVWKKSNAAVHLGWRVQSDNIPQKVCIKHFPRTTKEINIEKEIQILNIIARGEQPSENNVIGFLGTDMNRGCTVLVFEMVQSSNFYTELQSISMDNIALYTCKLLQALDFLYQNDVVHRDVKPDNFLHNFETNTFKLIDFGSSEKGKEGFKANGGGTTGFKAPEILMGAMHQTAAVDIWSAGIILLIMLTGDRYTLSNATDKDRNWTHLKEITAIVGWKKMHDVAVSLDVAEKFTSHVQYQQSGVISRNVRGWTAIVEQKRVWQTDTDALDLLSQMLDVDPRTRVTARNALQHPFFKKFRK